MIATPMPLVSELLQSAVVKIGSQAKLARAAGVAQPTLSQAIKLGKVGPKLAIGIDRATEGYVSKSSLRPDLWGVQ